MRGSLAPQESKIMLVVSLFREGFQLVDRNAPCKEVVGRVNRNSKSRASEPKSWRFQCPSGVLVGWAPWRTFAALGRRLELGSRGGGRMRPDVQSPVAGSVGGAGCVLSGREGRVSCSIGAVGW
jgi:hypothetical protein